MEERRRSAGRRLELVQHLAQRRRRAGDVVPRGVEMAGIEPIAGPRSERGGNGGQNGADLVGGASHGEAGPGGILHQNAGGAFHGLERGGDRPGYPGDGLGAVTAGRGARMEAHGPDAERGRSFQLLAQSGACAAPLFLVGGRCVEHVGRVDHHVLRRDPDLRQGLPEPGHPFRPDRALVAVVLGNGGEDLQRAHSGGPSPSGGHVDAAIVHGVRADQSRPRFVGDPPHSTLLRAGPCCPLPSGTAPRSGRGAVADTSL